MEIVARGIRFLIGGACTRELCPVNFNFQLLMMSEIMIRPIRGIVCRNRYLQKRFESKFINMGRIILIVCTEHLSTSLI